MRKVAGDCDISLIERSTAVCLQSLEQVRITIGLSIVFIAGIQRAASVRNSQNVVCALCCSLSMIQTLPPEEGPACDNRADQKLSTCHSMSQYSRIDS